MHQAIECEGPAVGPPEEVSDDEAGGSGRRGEVPEALAADATTSTAAEPAVRLRFSVRGEDCIAVVLTVEEEDASSSFMPAPAHIEEEHEPLRALCLERDRLLAKNRAFQRAARQRLDARSKASRKSLQEVGGALLEGAEQRYVLCLAQLERLLGQHSEAEAAAARAQEPERARAAAAAARARSAKAALLQLATDIATASKRGAGGGATSAAGGSPAPSPSGKAGPAAVSERLLAYFLATEPAKAAEVEGLRLEAAVLAFQAGRAEAALREGERLQEGLHLLDYEQLRIENAALAAKLEGRGTEVQRLRAKLAEGVQVAAHLKQKLHCCEKERGALAERLAGAERRLQATREQLAGAKKRHGRLQAERDTLAQAGGLVTDKRCLADMQEQRARLAALNEQATQLAARLAAAGH